MSETSTDTPENRLAGETSPYLLQHAGNPVAWWPWGAAALAEAKALDRPILLSIGYAACHWCHVMAHESFEDEAVAGLMNRLFVNVKVDREERPDVDQIYMAALHGLGEPGGWPLTMFLTPDGEPFWGGTYFPPTARYGKPGFADVLRAVAQAHAEDKAQVAQNRQALMAHLARPVNRGSTGLSGGDLDAVARRLAGFIDPVWGGPRGAPKFPNASFLELVWRGGQRLGGQPLGDPALAEPVRTTLMMIARGGIHDHVGGGFARYAVDERWLVPHFEKMLYDNAQLLELMALEHARAPDPLLLAACEGIVAWLAREMRAGAAAGNQGAFAASLDADTAGVEGSFTVWTPADVEAVLGPEDGALVCRLFDIAPGGNWEGHSIPNRLRTPEPSPEQAARLPALLERLRIARDARPRPGRDDKVLADWNGLMIAALARAGVLLDRPAWIVLAAEAFAFVSDSMTRDGRLGHSFRAGRLTIPGLASDHGAMIRAATALAEAGHREVLPTAMGWAEVLVRDFWDETGGGVFWTAADAEALILRPRATLDEAVPNPNALVADALLRLAALTGEERWRERADTMLVALAPAMADNVFGHAGLLNALDLRLNGLEIVVVGEGEAAESLRAAALRLPYTGRTVLAVASPEALPAAHPVRAGAGQGARAYVCAGERCSLPVATVEGLRETAAAMRG